MNLRLAVPSRDFPRIASLLTSISPEPVTVADLEEDEARTMTGKHWRRWVVEDSASGVMGYAMVIRYPSQPPGWMNMELVVDAAYRRQGAGTMLYEAALGYAREHGAATLVVEVNDREPDGRRFAEQRGFHRSHHVLDAVLDLTAFDMSDVDHAETIARAELAGIRFTTLAALGKTEPVLRQLYDLNRMAVLDEPGSSGGFPAYENWLRIVVNARWYRAESQFIALDGDTLVGLAGVYNDPDHPQTMFNGLTGVRPEYRRRGIALALKLLTIRYAIDHGAHVVTTNIDDRNAPMLRINTALGYLPQSGHTVYQLTLS